VALHLVVDPDLLLIENGLLSAQIIRVFLNLVLLVLLLNQLNLVGDPVLLHVGSFVVDFLDLLLNVVTKVLLRTDRFVTITAILESSAHSVETIDLESLLLNAEESVLDVLLNGGHVVLFLLQLVDQVIKFLLKHLVLRLCVEVVEADT